MKKYKLLSGPLREASPLGHLLRITAIDRAGRSLAVVSILVCLSASQFPSPVAADTISDALVIHKSPGAVYEGWEKAYSVRLDRRPLARGTDGYRPQGGASETAWEPAVEFLWDFGDGTGPISTGERPSIVHRYMNLGDYTLRVEAKSKAGSVVGTKSVKVHNRRPYGLSVNAVEIEPETATFEFTVDGTIVPTDDVNYTWDFGDGTIEGGVDQWRMQHAYPEPGAYTVTVTASDEEGDEPHTKSLEIRSLGLSRETDLEADLEKAVVEGVSTRFKGEMSGSFGASLRAEVRPFAGIFLSPVGDGDLCRFMWTAFDPAHLATLTFIVDLKGLPNESGGDYRFRPGNVKINLRKSVEEYEHDKRLLLQGLAGGFGLGNLALQGAREKLAEQDSELDEGLQDEVSDRIGSLELGEREEQPDFGAPPATSPFGIDEGQSFDAVSGGVDMKFVPHLGAVGVFDLHLENTDDDSPFADLALSGEFGLDFAAAKRDGIMLWDQCKPAEFSIEKTRPKDEEMHVDERRPRVRANFSSKIDVDTLDKSTFQLTYRAADSGRPVAVDARIHRMGATAFLKPVKELWGGVTYTARIKTGDQGVRGRNGAALEDEGDSGWHTWSFITKVDFEAKGSREHNLACHVIQTARDVPLIPGKDAFARIHADWKKHPSVHPGDQVRGVQAIAILEYPVADGWAEVTSVETIFLRSDLQTDAVGDNRDYATTLRFTPEEGMPPDLRIALKVPTAPGEDLEVRYRGSCSTPIWDYQPEMTIDYHLLTFEPDEGDTLDREVEDSRERLDEKMGSVAKMIERGMPFKSLNARFKGVETIATENDPLIDVADSGGDSWRDVLERLRDAGTAPPRAEPCPPCLEALDRLADQSSADLVIGVLDFPNGIILPPMVAIRPFAETYPAVIFITADLAGQFIPGWIIHQIGHALGLPDAPAIIEFENAENAPGLHWSNQEIQWHDGIEGGWFSRFSRFSTISSSDFDVLKPLMYPNLEDTAQTFILRHHYLDIQELIEREKLFVD